MTALHFSRSLHSVPVQSIGEDVSLFSSSQNRKPRPTWDALCFAALTGTNSGSNQNDLVGSLESWNHPAAAAAAATNALCQLTPMQIGPGNAPSTDWSQVTGTPGSGAAAHWMGMNSTPVSLPGSNASDAVANNLTSGYLNDHSAPHPHQNGAALAAVAAAFGIGGSAPAPVPPHWTTSGPSGDPSKSTHFLHRSTPKTNQTLVRVEVHLIMSLRGNKIFGSVLGCISLLRPVISFRDFCCYLSSALCCSDNRNRCIRHVNLLMG